MFKFFSGLAFKRPLLFWGTTGVFAFFGKYAIGAMTYHSMFA